MGKKIWCAKVNVDGELKDVSEIYVGENGRAVRKYKRKVELVEDGVDGGELDYSSNIKREYIDEALQLTYGGAFDEFAGGWIITLPQYYKEISIELKTTGNASLTFMSSFGETDNVTVRTNGYEIHSFIFAGVQNRKLSCSFGRGNTDPGEIYIKNLYGLRG